MPWSHRRRRRSRSGSATGWPIRSRCTFSDACTLPVNMAGLPGVSIPCGMSEGLPVGLQLIGSAWSEASLFGLARGYEAITADAPWRGMEPSNLAAAADPDGARPRANGWRPWRRADRLIHAGEWWPARRPMP